MNGGGRRKFGCPLGAKANGDFAEGGAGAQGPLGAVVGRGNVAVRHDDEDMKTKKCLRVFLTSAGV